MTNDYSGQYKIFSEEKLESFSFEEFEIDTHVISFIYEIFLQDSFRFIKTSYYSEDDIVIVDGYRLIELRFNDNPDVSLITFDEEILKSLIDNGIIYKIGDL